MKDPRHYLDEIQRNVEKMRAQGNVTPAENALFGMVDGLAGLTLQTMERVALCEQHIRELEAATGFSPRSVVPVDITPTTRPAVPQ